MVSLRVEESAYIALKKGQYENTLKILMGAYGNQIFRFCVSMLLNKEDAQDVLQYVYMNAFEGLNSFQCKSSFRTWLYSIARNRCLDFLKSKTRFQERVQFSESIPEQVIDSEIALDIFKNNALEHCLNQLSQKIKSAVLLRFQLGCSYEEMSEVCEEKTGALQARVARALPALRACLNEQGVEL